MIVSDLDDTCTLPILQLISYFQLFFFIVHNNINASQQPQNETRRTIRDLWLSSSIGQSPATGISIRRTLNDGEFDVEI